MDNTTYMNLHSQQEQLLLDIELLKKQLIEVGLLIGLNHPKTVLLSQELDKLIVKYQKYNFPK